MGDLLPNNWVEVQLIELLETLENGSRPKGGVQGILDGIPSLGGEHLNADGGFKFEKIKYIPLEFAQKLNRGKIQQKDILIVKDGATTGKTSFVNDSFPFKNAFVNEHVFICRTLKGVNPKCLFYFLWGKKGQERILANFTGSAQGGINQKFAQNTLIPLPPLPEQNRIVEKLDVLFGHLEQIKTKLDRIPGLLKNFRQAVLNEAVTRELTESNSVTNLGEFNINIQTGPFGSALHKHEYVENGIPVINPSHILDGNIIPNNQVTISENKCKELKRWKLEDGDVIVGRRGEMGRAAVYSKNNETMICGTGSLILKRSLEIDPHFLMFHLRSPFVVDFLERNSVGSTMVNLNQKIIKSIPFPDISIKEQQERIEMIESLFAKADKIEKQYQNLKEKTDTLPQAILAKAFKGELVEQLPTDGDARELLAEIEKAKAELSKTAKPKRGKTRKIKGDEDGRMVAEPKGRYGK